MCNLVKDSTGDNCAVDISDAVVPVVNSTTPDVNSMFEQKR